MSVARFLCTPAGVSTIGVSAGVICSANSNMTVTVRHDDEFTFPPDTFFLLGSYTEIPSAACFPPSFICYLSEFLTGCAVNPPLPGYRRLRWRLKWGFIMCAGVLWDRWP